MAVGLSTRIKKKVITYYDHNETEKKNHSNSKGDAGSIESKVAAASEEWLSVALNKNVSFVVSLFLYRKNVFFYKSCVRVEESLEELGPEETREKIATIT